MRIKNGGAVALGIFFGVGTCVLMNWDVRSIGDITPDHILGFGTLVGTIAAGHYFLPALNGRNILAALGLAVAFCAGTFMCVTGSAGRGGEAIEKKATEARSINTERDDAITELKIARAKRGELATSFAKECATGKGSRCAGTKETISYADSHIAILEARLKRLAPTQVANGKIKTAAAVLGRFSSRSPADIAQDLELAWPFASALIWELLTIVFLSLGLGHRAEVRGTVVPDLPVTSVRSSWPTSPIAPPAIARQENVRLLLPPPPTEHPVILALRQAGQPLSNDELAAVMGVSSGESSKRTREVANLIRVARSGRKLAISLNTN